MIEICDIKNKKRSNIGIMEINNTFNVCNRTQSGPLQERHGGHDEDGVHYEDSTGIDHPPPDSKSN